MTFVVAFNGGRLSVAALERASRFAAAFEEPLEVVTVVPKGNRVWARDRALLESSDAFDLGTVVERLRDRVVDVAPDAAFRSVTVGRGASAGTIASRIKTVARDEGASMVFVGSDNAGNLVTQLSSVAGTVAASSGYDVVIVQSPVTTGSTPEAHRATDERGGWGDS
jgi:nucleotide-binding universal stress UspA family protein